MSDTNRTVQPQKIVRGLKFRIQKEEGLYYLCSENKGADQLCGYCTADLRLCFRICKKPFFSHDAAHIDPTIQNGYLHCSWYCAVLRPHNVNSYIYCPRKVGNIGRIKI